MAVKQLRRSGKRVKKLTYEQKRRAYRTYSNVQRGSGSRRTGEKSEANPVPSRKGKLWQLTISAMVLIAVVAVKLTAPQTLEQFRGRLLDLMGANTDFVEVFSAVGKAVGAEKGLGEALNDAYVAVFGTEDESSEEGEASDESKGQPYSEENIPGNACLSQKILGFPYQRPVEGIVSDGFGYRRHPIDEDSQFHYGLDIEADEGTAISSFADGTVTAVGESSLLGKYVTVLHANNYTTLYAHCSRIMASSGQQVRMGDPIAEVGQTGQATGPHLHFELHLDTVYLNPIYYVAA